MEETFPFAERPPRKLNIQLFSWFFSVKKGGLVGGGVAEAGEK